MLGLIFGTRAGETSFVTDPLTLPRFLLVLPPLTSFLSLRIAEGVPTAIGEPASDGLPTVEPGLADDGVLNGPSFGVLRADSRGVLSSALGRIGCVLI